MEEGKEFQVTCSNTLRQFPRFFYFCKTHFYRGENDRQIKQIIKYSQVHTIHVNSKWMKLFYEDVTHPYDTIVISDHDPVAKEILSIIKEKNPAVQVLMKEF